jgi:hypothetical protein
MSISAKAVGALVVILTISAFAAVPAIGEEASTEAESAPEAPSLQASQGCIANYVCAYSAANYEGTRYPFACSNYGEIGGAYMRSATNRCGDKANALKIGGSILACMNPGGNRPDPGLFTSVFIMHLGSRC